MFRGQGTRPLPGVGFSPSYGQPHLTEAEVREWGLAKPCGQWPQWIRETLEAIDPCESD